jgi:hypothetical protein
VLAHRSQMIFGEGRNSPFRVRRAHLSVLPVFRLRAPLFR